MGNTAIEKVQHSQSTSVKATCQGCKQTKSLRAADQVDAIRILEDSGWRIHKGKFVCGNCGN